MPLTNCTASAIISLSKHCVRTATDSDRINSEKAEFPTDSIQSSCALFCAYENSYRVTCTKRTTSALLRKHRGWYPLRPKAGMRDRRMRPLFHDDFKDLRPILPGDKQPLPPRVPGDAIEHIFLLPCLRLSNRREVDPRRHLPRLRIDLRNPVRVPDIRPDLSSNEFQLIQIRHRFRPGKDFHRLRNLKRLRIDVLQPVRPVAQNQRRFVMRQSPAFGAVWESSKLPKRPQVVDESGLIKPGQLINLSVKNRKPFAK